MGIACSKCSFGNYHAKRKKRLSVELIQVNPIELTERIAETIQVNTIEKEASARKLTPQRRISMEISGLLQGKSASRYDELIKFVEMSKLLLPNIGLDSVILIPRKTFLAMGELVPFEMIQDKIITAEDIKYMLEENLAKVLFISHRWGSLNSPDDQWNNQYKAICCYLDLNLDISFIWIDFSSVSQLKGEELFWKHLENIPTALYAATDILVIPKIDPNFLRTDLADYLSRSWCCLESFIALVSNANINIYFRDGDFETFIPVDFDEGEDYHCAVSNALEKLKPKSNYFSSHWSVANRDPAVIAVEIRNDIASIIESNDDMKLRILRQCLRMRLRFNMAPGSLYPLNEQVGQLKVWDCLGDAAIESDKSIVLNLMMYVVLYVDGYIFSKKSEEEIKALIGDLAVTQSLVLHNKFLSPAHFIQILKIINDSDHMLEEMHVRSNFTCGAKIAPFLLENPSIKVVSLNFEGIHDKSDIFNALHSNISLTHLDLTGNPGVGNAGAKKIATYLAVNNTMKILVLDDTHIKTKGATAIAEALELNCCLETLSLAKNKFGSRATILLLEVTRQSGTLKYLNLSENRNIRRSIKDSIKTFPPLCSITI